MLGMTGQAKERKGDRRSGEPATSFQRRECEILSFCIIIQQLQKRAGNETQQSAEFMDCIVLLSLLERQTCLGEIRSFPDQVNQSYLKTENQIQQKHTGASSYLRLSGSRQGCRLEILSKLLVCSFFFFPSEESCYILVVNGSFLSLDTS